ncbi:hypothetical protein Tco_0575293 [Tanacetum coccineum]
MAIPCGCVGFKMVKDLDVCWRSNEVKMTVCGVMGLGGKHTKEMYSNSKLGEEEVVVKRSDQQLYKFKEGDFVDLHLNDIEDMILLAVQHKLFHLDESDVVDFIMALRMFTRSLILKRRVEDLQLGVESYQKKLNITKPQKTFQGIEFTEPYTPSYDPPGIVYEDLNKQKRVLQADELYKFLDGTLKSVRNEIHHRVLDFRLEYNKEMPKRKWTAVDRRRSSLMIELIDKQLREKEIIKNPERLVGAIELEMDYKLMTRESLLLRCAQSSPLSNSKPDPSENDDDHDQNFQLTCSDENDSVPTRDLESLLHLTHFDTPCQNCVVMKEAKELSQFVESLERYSL